MTEYDLPLAELERFRSDEPEPEGFDAFWAGTLAETRAHDLDPRFTDVDEGYSELLTQDVRFAGWGGQEVRGWFVAPRRASGPLPVVVSFVGYGGGRGLVGAHTAFASAGFAQLVMDTRGQGSRWRSGDTFDGELGPDLGAVMTRGIRSPETYYYRRLYADAVRAVEAAAAHPLADAARIVTQGGSQGGALSVVASVLSGAAVGAVVDVPFLSTFRRATRITDADPYGELVTYLRIHRDQVETVFHTLSFVDVVHFAGRATTPALFSVGLRDETTPPSTVYAVHNAWGGPKSITVYPFNGHENGEDFAQRDTIAWMKRLLADLG